MKVTYPELATVLGISDRTLRRWVRAGLVEAPGLGRAWSAEGAVAVARRAKVAPARAWVDALTPGQRELLGLPAQVAA